MEPSDAPESAPPLPDPADPILAGYWEAADREELVVQRCTSCDRSQWPPRAGCASCGPGVLGWRTVAGTGTLFTWTTVHHTTLDHYRSALPFALAVVELDDAPVRMLGRVRGVDPARLRVDLDLRVAFEPVAPGVRLPVWEAP